MAGFTIKLEVFYNAWKAMQDWITGSSANKPKVEVDGTVEVSNLPTTQQVTATEPLPVSINNSNMTLYGADIADRPAADSVPVGATFTIANADLDTWISNGTDWVVI